MVSNDDLIPIFRRFDRTNKGFISLEDFNLMLEPRLPIIDRRPVRNEIQKILYGDDWFENNFFQYITYFFLIKLNFN